MERPGVGVPLRPLRKPRLTSSHIVRWLAAQQNWDKIHYDQGYCRDIAKLPGPVINGALKQHFIVQFLADAFGSVGWVWRVEYQFLTPDPVGSLLEVRGHTSAVQEHDAWLFASVDIEIHNLDTAEISTRGAAVVVLRVDGGPVLDGLEFHPPEAFNFHLDHIDVDTEVSPDIRRRVGTVLETRESFCPVDLSRLRIFADAIMGLAPIHFDPASASADRYGEVVAAPLFPLHALEARPGSRPLSDDLRAFGREGVNEIGRDMESLFHVESAGLLNGGNRVEVHSLARCGERISANSTLVGARLREGRRGGKMLIFDTFNRYWESGGRLLLVERQTIIHRL